MSRRWDDEERERALHVGVGMSSPLWTAAWFAMGLSAAYWWWSQMGSRLVHGGASTAATGPLGPSPEPARPGSPVGSSGEAPVEVAPPELVMAHNPPPPEAPDHPAHPSDDAIPEPPPEMLAHTPPEGLGVSFKPGTGFENPTHDPDSVFPSPGEDDRSTTPRDKAGGASPAAHAAVSVSSDAHAPKKPRVTPSTEPGAPSVILATPPGEPVFDPEALATETSVAALTAGEALDETATPEQAIGEPSPVRAPKPRTRRKPGTAPEG